MTALQVTPNHLGSTLTGQDVLTLCRAAQHTNIEVSDQVARVIAVFFQAPGSVLSRFAHGFPTEHLPLLADIRETRTEVAGWLARTPAELAQDHLMLDMLGTWIIRQVNDHGTAVVKASAR